MRSILFQAAFWTWSVICVFGGSPLLLLNGRTLLMKWARVYTGGVCFLMRTIGGIDLQVHGRENIPAGPVIIACKHQSWGDGFFLFPQFDDPAFIISDQFLRYPLIGRAFRKMEAVIVDNQRGGPLGRSRLGRCTVGGSGAAAAALVAGGLVAAERLAQAARYRGLHSGGRGFDEFALFAQTGEYLLTGDTEFLGQLVHTGLTCHYISCLEATAVVGAAPRFSYDAWSSGLHGVLMFFATCSLGAAVSGRSDESKRSITAVMSGEPVIRSARPNARRRTAACRHSDRGCNQAPRPGSAFAVSTVTTTWPFPGPSPLSTATTRSNSTASSRFRHPMQVRTGPGGGLLRCIRADSSRWTTAESTVTASPN